MIKASDLVIKLCPSSNTPFLGAEVGVEIKHIPTGLVVKSVDRRSQYQNKKQALKQMEKELLRQN